MKERILEFLRTENKSSAQLAEEIGVQPSGISHILSGRNNPSLDFILKMLEKYPCLSTEWLLFGKGKMYREQTISELFENSDNLSGKPEDKEPVKQTLREPGKLQEKISTDLKEKSGVEKIVWFYTDKSFREYYPGTDTEGKP
jgi:transcriptional regulator with XRE-family HTH domain